MFFYKIAHWNCSEDLDVTEIHADVFVGFEGSMFSVSGYTDDYSYKND